MKTAFFGYQGRGKTTLAAFLAGRRHESYDPLKPALFSVRVGDPRLERLSALSAARKITFPEFTIFDFRGVAPSSGWDSRVFTRLTEADLVLLVADGFSPGSRPGEEIESLCLELVFHDCQRLAAVLEKRGEEESGSRRKAAPGERECLEKALGDLEKEKPLFSVPRETAETKLLSSLGLVTNRPIIGLVNGPSFAPPETADRALPVFGFDISREAEQKETGAFWAKFLPAAGLSVFYTLSERENRGWVVPAGTTALEAAARVHTDFGQKFIRAEVVSAADLLANGSRAACREKGVLRLEGKNYPLADGDVLFFHCSG